MKSFFTLAAFAAGSHALVGRTDGCCFHLTASGGASGTLGQLVDGQNRIGDNSLPPATYCIDSTGGITDSSGRGCILTPPTTQFQCDTGATPTTGFSVSSSGQLLFQGSPNFVACETGQNGGMNIYTTNSSAVTMCKSVQLNADTCKGTGVSPVGSSPAAGSSTPVASPAPSSPVGSAPASSVPAPSTPSGAAPVGSAPASSAPLPGAPTTVFSTVTVTACSCPPTSVPGAPAPAPSSVAPAPSSGAPAPAPAPSSGAPAPSGSAPAASSGTPHPSSGAPAPSGSAPAPSGSAPAPKPSSTFSSVPAPSGSPSPSAPASSASAIPSGTSSAAPSGTSAAGACATTLSSGNFEFPHLIIPINSGSPNTAYGTQFNGTVNSTISSIFNFDIPSSDTGKTCSLVFLFPQKADLQTSSFEFSGNGRIDVAQLSNPASSSTTFHNAPSVMKNLGAITVAPGTNQVVSTFSCPAGQTVAFEMKNAGTTDLNFFEDFNPSPIGLFITTC